MNRRDLDSRRRFNTVASTSAFAEVLRGGKSKGGRKGRSSPTSVLDQVPGGASFVKKVLEKAPITKKEEKKAFKAITDVVSASKDFDISKEIYEYNKRGEVPPDHILESLARVAALNSNEVVKYTTENPDIISNKATEMVKEKKGWIAWMRQKGADLFNTVSGWISYVWTMIKRCASSWACIASVALVAFFIYCAWFTAMPAATTSWSAKIWSAMGYKTSASTSTALVPYQAAQTAGVSVKAFIGSIWSMMTTFCSILKGVFDENIWVPLKGMLAKNLNWMKGAFGWNTKALTTSGEIAQSGVNIGSKAVGALGFAACTAKVGGVGTAVTGGIGAPFAFAGAALGCGAVSWWGTGAIGHVGNEVTLATERWYVDKPIPIAGYSVFDAYRYAASAIYGVVAAPILAYAGKKLNDRGILSKKQVEAISSKPTFKDFQRIGKAGIQARQMYTDTIVNYGKNAVKYGLNAPAYVEDLKQELKDAKTTAQKLKILSSLHLATAVENVKKKNVEDMSDDDKKLLAKVAARKKKDIKKVDKLQGKKLDVAARVAKQELTDLQKNADQKMLEKIAKRRNAGKK